MEEKIMISTILRNFDITATRNSNDIPVMPQIVLHPKGGINLKLKRRK